MQALPKSPGGGERVADLMVKAFEGLSEDEKLALAAKSIDLELSFRSWMGSMLGEEPYSERVDLLIAEGNAEGLRTMAAEDDPHLSPSEHRILLLSACGLTVKEAAEETGLGFETVKELTKRVRQKLGARNTTHAVVLALAKGLFEEALAS